MKKTRGKRKNYGKNLSGIKRTGSAVKKGSNCFPDNQASPDSAAPWERRLRQFPRNESGFVRGKETVFRKSGGRASGCLPVSCGKEFIDAPPLHFFSGQKMNPEKNFRADVFILLETDGKARGREIPADSDEKRKRGIRKFELILLRADRLRRNEVASPLRCFQIPAEMPFSGEAPLPRHTFQFRKELCPYLRSEYCGAPARISHTPYGRLKPKRRFLRQISL